ncbi:23S rRNA (adenine(2503)-C(2))-methyltransferase RlmN [Anaeromicropila populeti]|uniref:Probable dual-specificity RNA methyltransferase RlmN n=1 Tax=Anaeromicropila populeti TaxID=37658 RepID=A0A1I6KWR8_9FIRM|nr:23S rRNA (adenine(2503)-C(2))-methyltransferase RlmN [Anaeromicropila populeti]SFR95614.1 23S rRNA (adenine2503-C2)-methyltransferase [Anaeromicropila populeti]
MEKADIRSLDYDDVLNQMNEFGEKSFRGKQVYEWLHKKLAVNFSEMTNLSKQLRENLEEKFYIPAVTAVESRTSVNGETTKYLFQLEDERVIESVLMKYKHGNSVCISSQVGCRMGCRFCASTIGGLERNLLPSEMLGQIYEIQKISGERVSNVVVMGTGEPLDNFENLIQFIKILTDENGLNISQRNITVSTCGLVEQIRRLGDLDLQITLAISLHAPNDELRKTLMPVANKYSIEEIMNACRYYYSITGRRLSFEYSLVEGVNDSEFQAKELAKLVKGMNCHINLIPVNPIKERDYKHSSMQFIQKFKNILEKNRINVTIRREMGADIDAACGQLRKSYMDHMQKGD